MGKIRTKFKFIECAQAGKGWVILNRQHGDELGEINWYAPWRRWVMYSDGLFTDWSSDCLRDVATFLDSLPKPGEVEGDN